MKVIRHGLKCNLEAGAATLGRAEGLGFTDDCWRDGGREIMMGRVSLSASLRNTRNLLGLTVIDTGRPCGQIALLAFRRAINEMHS